jgi:hypothetical protein
VQAFKGQMLRGHTEIVAQTGSGLPMSLAAKQAAIQQTLTLMLQAGLQIPERNLRKILGEYQIGGLEQFFASQERDGRQVAEENRRLAAGEVLPINAYDNDVAHIEGHEDFQKTARYQLLDERIKLSFEDHVARHRDRRAQIEMAQMQQQQAAVEPQGDPQAADAPPAA